MTAARGNPKLGQGHATDGLASMPSSHSTVNPLARYWAKRDFSLTEEPREDHANAGQSLSFVTLQGRAASRCTMTSGLSLRLSLRWRHRTWELVGDPLDGLKKGKLVFVVFGIAVRRCELCEIT